MPKEERDVKIFAFANDFHAPSMEVIMVCRGGQSPSLPKDSTWHTAQYINYGSTQCACMSQVI